MEREVGENLRYRVLFTRTEKQTRLAEALSELLPEGRGRAFVPLVENYRRDRREVERKALFPGYVFLHTDIGFAGIHELAAKSRERMSAAAVRELGRLKWHGDEPPEEGEAAEENDLSDGEAAFLERILGGGTVLRMSECYQDGRGFVVMKGPLAGLESQIRKVDKHNRRAVLKSRLLGRNVVAGLWVRPKAAFFEGNVGELPDGSEVDLAGLEEKMMGGK